MPAERYITGQEPIKPGETREATPDDYLWMQALLRYSRTAEMATPGPDVPNMTTLFSGFTSRYRPGQITFLFRSWHHTDHAHAILKSVANRNPNEPLRPNVAMKVVNGASAENNLMMAGFAEPVAPEEVPHALAALNDIRRLKRLPEMNLDPKNEEDKVPEILFAVRVLAAQTQGERFLRGRHVGEGHPQLLVPKLLGFEDLPQINGFNMPLTKADLRAFLRSKGYPH